MHAIRYYIESAVISCEARLTISLFKYNREKVHPLVFSDSRIYPLRVQPRVYRYAVRTR